MIRRKPGLLRASATGAAVAAVVVLAAHFFGYSPRLVAAGDQPIPSTAVVLPASTSDRCAAVAKAWRGMRERILSGAQRLELTPGEAATSLDAALTWMDNGCLGTPPPGLHVSFDGEGGEYLVMLTGTTSAPQTAEQCAHMAQLVADLRERARADLTALSAPPEAIARAERDLDKRLEWATTGCPAASDISPIPREQPAEGHIQLPGEGSRQILVLQK